MTNVPAIRQDAALMPQTFDGMLQQAEVLVKSGLLPQSVKTPAAAVAIMLTGRELGIPPMQAFRSIYVVNGNPTISTELMAAMLLQAGITYQIEHLDTEKAIITFKRANGMTYTSTFTIKDAGTAGLAGKGPWKMFPKDMLYNRAFSSGARKIAPDVLAKMYTPEELAPDSVSYDGESWTVDAEARVVEPDPPPHWIDDEDTRKRFWVYAGNLGLDKAQVYEALGVEAIHDYEGTMKECKDTLDAWADALRTEPEPEPAAKETLL